MADDASWLPIRDGERPRAVVVAVQTRGVDDGELASSIAELERLAKTLGVDPIGRITQRRAKLAPGVVLGEGKLRELATWTGGPGEISAYVAPGRPARDAGEPDDDEDEDEQEDGEGDAAAAARAPD